MSIKPFTVHLDEGLLRELKGFVAYRGITLKTAADSALRLMLRAQGAERVEPPTCNHKNICWGECGKDPKHIS